MEFKECNSVDDFISFFDNDERAIKHTNYYHYTSLSSVNSILDTKCLLLTSLARKANDGLEKQRYEKLGNNVFSICFSTGTSESLPLWYLYSGIDGCGARIEIKKKKLIDLIRSAEISLAETESSDSNKPITGSQKLLSADEYSIICRDILYLGSDPSNEGHYRAKYAGQSVNGITEGTYKAIDDKYKRFVKSLIWFYEKETRLQVEVTNQSLLKPGKNYVISLNIEPVFNDLSIRLAPEFGQISVELFEKYPDIKAWAYSKLKKSEFAGQVKMRLKEKMCKDCDKNRENVHAGYIEG